MIAAVGSRIETAGQPDRVAGTGKAVQAAD